MLHTKLHMHGTKPLGVLFDKVDWYVWKNYETKYLALSHSNEKY